MKTTLPEAFVARMTAQLGEEADAFFYSLQQPVPTSLRLHHLKGRSSYDLNDPVLWCDTGYYLKSRPFFYLDPHWHGGAYYVQEASSMILDEVLSQLQLDDQPRIWLDLCAAPGGKTGILAKHIKTADVLIANEVVPQRKAILRENLVKAGLLNTFITGKSPSSFHTPLADIILVDAPCAGEGMMRKDPEAIAQWTPSLVLSCAALQNEIVHDAFRALKPGGYLIYSTCSYSREENILNVLESVRTLELESVSISFPPLWSISTIEQEGVVGYQLYPHQVRGEGLFIAVLKRSQKALPSHTRYKKTPHPFQEIPQGLAEHIDSPASYLMKRNSERHEVISHRGETLASEVLTQIPSAELIVEAGQVKGKDFVPSHSLAMSGLAHARYEIIDLDLSAALDFLERQVHTLPSGFTPGWYIVRHDLTILGWAKSTLQGWKNHYPMPWRLRDRRVK